jgi:hypothetical protein
MDPIEKYILFYFFYDRPECMDHAATLFCATLILTKATADAHSNKISLRRDYRVSGKSNLCILLNIMLIFCFIYEYLKDLLLHHSIVYFWQFQNFLERSKTI